MAYKMLREDHLLVGGVAGGVLGQTQTQQQQQADVAVPPSTSASLVFNAPLYPVPLQEARDLVGAYSGAQTGRGVSVIPTVVVYSGPLEVNGVARSGNRFLGVRVRQEPATTQEKGVTFETFEIVETGEVTELPTMDSLIRRHQENTATEDQIPAVTLLAQYEVTNNRALRVCCPLFPVVVSCLCFLSFC